MPTYTIKDIKTNKEWDIRCSYDDLQKQLNEDPNVIRVVDAPTLVTGAKSTLRQAGGEWKDLLGAIKKNSGRGNTIND
mgnify:FL=1|jgi:hypothetical protein